jgi:PAS domain S-box-containing protein
VTTAQTPDAGDQLGQDQTAGERLALLAEAAQVLIGSLAHEEVLPAVLGLSQRLIAADAYAVWRFLPALGEWKIVASTGLSAEYLRSSIPTTRDGVTRLPADPLLIEDVRTAPILAGRQEGYAKEHIRSLLVVPLCIHGENTGTITFYFRVPRRFEPTDVRLAQALTNLAASAIGTAELHEEQKRLRARAEEAQKRQAFLDEVNTALAAFLDYEVTLRSLAELCVPTLADWCAIDVASEETGGSIRRLAVAHKDPKKREWARDLERRYPTNPDAPRGVPGVLRSGKAEFYPLVTEDMLEAAARDPEHLHAIREVGLRSVLIVPLSARGRTLAALTLVTTEESGRLFTQEDLAFAQEMARRAALAVDNARLYRDAMRASAEAQREIAERKRAEETLRVHSHVLESMSEGVSLSDEVGIILYTNPAEDRMFGYAPGELVGQHVTVQNTYPPEENRRIVGEVIEVLKTRGIWEGEFRNVRKDGTPFTTLAHITSLETEGRRHWVCVQRDITEEKQARETLRESEAKQRAFMRDVLFGVSEGKLRLCEAETDLPARLPPAGAPVPLSARTLALLRRQAAAAAATAGLAAERAHDLTTAVSEAAMNAVVHAGGGAVEVCASGDGVGTVQVWIRDQGKGIATNTLHRATLERGFTTAGTLGHGFWLMLRTADRVYLLTGSGGTTVVVELDRVPPPPPWPPSAPADMPAFPAR